MALNREVLKNLKDIYIDCPEPENGILGEILNVIADNPNYEIPDSAEQLLESKLRSVLEQINSEWLENTGTFVNTAGTPNMPNDFRRGLELSWCLSEDKRNGRSLELFIEGRRDATYWYINIRLGRRSYTEAIAVTDEENWEQLLANRLTELLLDTSYAADRTIFRIPLDVS